MKQALPAVLIVALLAACTGVGPGTPKPGVRGHGSPAPASSIAALPTTSSGDDVLRAPAGHSTALTGHILLDAAYALEAGGATFSSQDHAGLIANNGAGLVANNAGNLVGRDPADVTSHLGADLTGKVKLISDNGGGLVSNNGSGVISNNGGSMTGATRLEGAFGLVGMRSLLAESAATHAALPVAGMLVAVRSLADGAFLPLGVDRAGQTVYAVYTDADGGFTVHLPQNLAGNVLVVTSVAGTEDTRLALDLVARPTAAGTLRIDDGSTVLTSFLRRVFASRIEEVVDPQACRPAANMASAAVDVVSVGLSSYQDEFEGEAFKGLSRLARRRVLFRFADAIIAQLDLDAIQIVPNLIPDSAARGAAWPVLGKLVAQLETAAARRLDADPHAFDNASYVKLANLMRGDAPPIVIRKPADLTEFLVTEFLASNDRAVTKRMETMLVDVGLDTSVQLDMSQAGAAIIAWTAPVVVTEEGGARLRETIRTAIADEVAAGAAPPDAPCSPTPAPPVVEAEVTTLAGGSQGFADGPGAGALFDTPNGLLVDPQGRLIVSDASGNRLRLVDLGSPLHTVSSLAGNGKAGFADGPIAEAQFKHPTGLALDARGTLYVSDTLNHRIRAIAGYGTPAATVSTFAGDGTAGIADGPAAQARFNAPEGLAFGPDGTLYVADTKNHCVRRISPDGLVSTLAGDGESHLTNGFREKATFNEPRGLLFPPGGPLVVADSLNNVLRTVTPEGGVVILAGNHAPEFSDGTAYTGALRKPIGLAVAPSGGVLVADSRNHRIRWLKPEGWLVSVAGGGPGGEDAGAFADGRGAEARFSSPTGLAVGPDGTVYVADADNHRIRALKLPAP